MEIPTDINGFYNYLKAAKTLKEDDDQFYPMCVPSYGLIQSLSIRLRLSMMRQAVTPLPQSEQTAAAPEASMQRCG